METELMAEIREMIYQSCDLEDMDRELLQPDDLLFGPDSPLELDSVDSLEIIVALQREYGDGARIADRNAARDVLISLRTLHDFVAANRTQ